MYTCLSFNPVYNYCQSHAIFHMQDVGHAACPRQLVLGSLPVLSCPVHSSHTSLSQAMHSLLMNVVCPRKLFLTQLVLGWKTWYVSGGPKAARKPAGAAWLVLPLHHTEP